MQNAFPGHFPLSQDQREKLWASGVLVLDANALLNLYRYSSSSRSGLMTALETLQERLWIPHQVASEFLRNRVEVIRSQRSTPAEYAEMLNKLRNHIDQSFRQFSRKAIVPAELHGARLLDAVNEIEHEFRAKSNDLLIEYGIEPQEDSILGRLGVLYEGKVGPRLDSVLTEKILKEGVVRYQSKIPPGFSDVKKPEPERYGDLLLWKQLIEYAKDGSRDVLFVTDDGKEDWWWVSSGQKLGPHPDLRAEFSSETNGGTYYSYRPDQFLDGLEERGMISISSGAVEEIRETPSLGNWRDYTPPRAKAPWQLLLNADAIGRLYDLVNDALRGSVDDTIRAIVTLERNLEFTIDAGRAFGQQLAELHEIQSARDAALQAGEADALSGTSATELNWDKRLLATHLNDARMLEQAIARQLPVLLARLQTVRDREALDRMRSAWSEP